MPTPLEPLPGLSRRFGVEMLIKRDDLTGFAAGGNKARKLEYLMADAVAAQAHVVIAAGYDQSNQARMTAAACARLGIACELYLCGELPERSDGNLLLDELFGARVTIVPSTPRLETCLESLDVRLQQAATEARAQNRTSYVIRFGDGDVAGAIGYVVAAREIAGQLASMGTDVDYVITAAGSCATQAGLEVGLRLFYPRAQVLGISVGGSHKRNSRLVAGLAEAAADALEVPLRVSAHDIQMFTDYIGEGFGLPSQAGAVATVELARTDGIILDPIYTAKAMAGLLDLVRRGDIRPSRRALFIHTGGLPAFFAHGQPGLHIRDYSQSSS
ncbi:MAG: D-cysteine desulfhydrase family protein [Chloroflexi bacterium]|nr:D-cysteine desulfhydrase family protein [Chloroflexota bacterium]